MKFGMLLKYLKLMAVFVIIVAAVWYGWSDGYFVNYYDKNISYYRESLKLSIVTGKKGNPYDQLAQRYKKFLEARGVDVELIEETGTPCIWKKLQDGSSNQAGFLQGGFVTESDAFRPELIACNTDRDTSAFQEDDPKAKNIASRFYSLGRVLTEPVWIFYRKQTLTKPDRLSQLKGRQIQIGRSGSGVNPLAKKLLEASGLDIKTLSERDDQDLMDLKNDLSAEFLVAGSKSPKVRSLIHDPAIGLMNMAQADALVQIFPYLQKVTLGLGAFGIELDKEVPEENTTLVATRAAFVVDKGMDVALQHLLAQAVLDAQRRPGNEASDRKLAGNDFFRLKSSDLEADDSEFEISPEARRVYRSEKTFFERVMPSYFRLAKFLDAKLGVILSFGFIFVIWPLINALQSGLNTIVKVSAEGLGSRLHALRRSIAQADHPELISDIEDELAEIATKLDRMRERVVMRLPLSYWMDLKAEINEVQRLLRRWKTARKEPSQAQEDYRVPA